MKTKALNLALAGFIVISVALLTPALGRAVNQADIEVVPGKDIPYLPPMQGSLRYAYKYDDYGVYKFTVGFDSDDNGIEKAVEGKHYHIEYYLFTSKSKLEVMRNYENAFKRDGWKLLVPVDINKLHLGMVTAEKTSGGQDIFAEVQVTDDEGPDDQGRNVIWYQFEVVEVKAMNQEVEISASRMKEELDAKGFIAIYGIKFDTGKATIKPDSEKTLAEIGKLLNDYKDLKLSIEGHTDNVGDKASNQKLSEQRAASVKDYLVKNFKIDASRLATKGYGDTKPVADNKTEEGRAKNRRVELVKMK